MEHLKIDDDHVEQVVEEIPIEQDEELNALEKPKKIRRGRKPMSEAQKEALRAGREKAKLNQQRRMLKEREDRLKAEGLIEQKNAKIEPEGGKEENKEAENEPYSEPDYGEANVVRSNKVKIVKVKKPKAKPKPKPKKEIVYVEESSTDDDDEPEVIYRKRRPRTHGRHYSNIEEVVNPQPTPQPSLIFK
jgi:hypothetical protein